MKYFSTLISHFSFQKGFSFIELLVVFSIMGIVGVIGMASFIGFSNNQAVDAAASEVVNSLTIARQRALSQIKPDICTASQTLSGYRVLINPTSGSYRVEAACGSQTVQVSAKTLPPQISFEPSSLTTVFFNVSTGTVSTPGTVTVRGFGQTKQIVIESSGIISRP